MYAWVGKNRARQTEIRQLRIVSPPNPRENRLLAFLLKCRTAWHLYPSVTIHHKIKSTQGKCDFFLRLPVLGICSQLPKSTLASRFVTSLRLESVVPIQVSLRDKRMGWFLSAQVNMLANGDPLPALMCQSSVVNYFIYPMLCCENSVAISSTAQSKMHLEIGKRYNITHSRWS